MLAVRVAAQPELNPVPTEGDAPVKQIRLVQKHITIASVGNNKAVAGQADKTPHRPSLATSGELGRATNGAYADEYIRRASRPLDRRFHTIAGGT